LIIKHQTDKAPEAYCKSTLQQCRTSPLDKPVGQTLNPEPLCWLQKSQAQKIGWKKQKTKNNQKTKNKKTKNKKQKKTIKRANK